LFGGSIDHTGIVVSEFERSKSFYRAALAPLGLVLVAEYPASITGSTDVAGFGLPPKDKVSMSPEFWISRGTPNSPSVHVAFKVQSRALVEAFYSAALV
jgi:catechol 2,3-dioxygenase-like lactoylglutathione lyase family enzyme